MTAIEILQGKEHRIIKIEYKDTTWNSIRIGRFKKGIPDSCYLERFTGVIGDLRIEEKEINIDQELTVL